MKCNNCHNEWNEIDNKYYIFCPFCHELLVHISEEINTMEDALNYLTQKYNSEILSDKQTVLQFIDVILPGKKRVKDKHCLIHKIREVHLLMLWLRHNGWVPKQHLSEK